MIQETIPGMTSSHSNYLACYQTHLKALTGDMDDEEVDELKEMAKEWNESGPPEAVKRK